MTGPNHDRKESRRSRRLLKRQAEILDAAKTVFLGREFSQVTMEEIADEAAMSRATIYQYFGNKVDLYGSVLLRDMERLATVMEDAFDPGRDLATNLNDMARAYFSFFTENDIYFKKFSFFYLPGREEPLPPDVRNTIDDRLAEAIAAIERCIANGIRRGEARPVDARAMALALWGLWKGCAYVTITGNTERFSKTLEEVAAAGLDAMLVGLLAPSPARTSRTGTTKREAAE